MLSTMYGESGEYKRLRVRDLCCFLFAGVFILAVGIVGGILIGIYAYHGGPGGNTNSVECVYNSGSSASGQSNQSAGPPTSTPKIPSSTDRTLGNNGNQSCPRRNPFVPNTKEQIFAPLTQEEYRKVKSIMVERGLVTDVPASMISVQSNYITAIDISSPKKEDVLKHLDHGAPFPGRFAQVTVVRGARSEPDVMIYEVGPLHDTDIGVKNLYADGEISFEARAIDVWEVAEYRKLLKPFEDEVEGLVSESFDGSKFGDGFIDWWPYVGPPGPTEKQRKQRNTKLNAYLNPLQSEGEYNLLDMLPLAVTIHCNGNDPSKWYVYGIYYVNQGPFDNATSLMNAYRNDEIRKVQLPREYRETIKSHFDLRRDKQQPMRAFASMPPPTTYEPMGPRYTIEGHHVMWMGWEFDVTSRMMRGPAVFDIKYKDNRIAYELSLNEISLIYASDSYERSNVVYTDATYGIGFYSGILKNVDCPEHASLLDTSFYDAINGAGVSSKSICIFESDAEEASWRHTAYSFYGGLRRTYLVVRFTVAIVNYDYIVEFQFRLDGKLFTKTKATGFIQIHFWDADNPNRKNSMDDTKDGRDPFGFKVGDYTHGLIHDHMFGFKVDLDILGTNNSFEAIHFKAGPAVEAYQSQDPSVTKQPDYFTFNVTRYLKYETIERERGFRLNPEEPKFWTVVNENYRNKWGVKRGYQIAPLETALQNMGDEHPVFPALSFSKYTCAVTKYRDSEPFLDSIFDGFSFDAKEHLDKRLNNESIRNDDLVTWVTVGFLHVPTSEDYPMTVSLETGFILKPFNFFDETDVFDMPSLYGENGQDQEMQITAEPCM